MKARKLLVARIGIVVLAGGLIGNSQLIQSSARAQVSLSVGLNINAPADFYTPLTPYGAWVDLPRYGHCWRPSGMVTGWRPYTVGHWEWTDVGWYWVSDEPWAWACYHYGYWNSDPAYGWIWVPGTEWSPAWVTWREAPDYIGWAPCGPGGVAVADSYFVFVDVHHFHDRIVPRELVYNDPRVFQRSRVVGGFRTETGDFDGGRRRIAFNEGPGVAPIQRATGQHFTPRPVREVVQQTRVPEAVRGEPDRNRNATPWVTQQPARERAVQQQQQPPPRIYREATPNQPPPSGRQEPRIYREVPNPQPEPRQVPHPPTEVPRREPRPEVVNPTPRLAPTDERPEPPKASEHGKAEGQVRRQERTAPPPASKPENRRQQKDGE
jgi:hypothetical protein